MKKNVFIKIIFILAIITFALLLMEIKSYAASLSISTSKSSVAPGESFTVTVSLSGGAGSVTTSVSNGSGGKTDFLDNGSYSFSCTAGNSGSVTINASGLIGDYATETEDNKSASKTVKIVEPSSNSNNSSTPSGGGSSNSGGNSTTKKPTTTNTSTPKKENPKSSDNTLKELNITEGAISPEFAKDIKDYELIIPYEISEINITATPNDSKAKIDIEGNTDLKEGENIVKVSVTAEDGNIAIYTIKVTRKRVPIALDKLVIKYHDESGKLLDIPLNPEFRFDILEYTLQDLEYWVEKLNIEAIPNIEGATVDIQGKDNLQVGENTIIITLKIAEENTPEGEEPTEEIITYTIKVNKMEEPTLIARISDNFKGIMGTVGIWFNNNQSKIVLMALALCIIALIGLSIYIVIDYNKYKDIIAKVKKVNEININSNIIEELAQESNMVKEENIEDNKNDKSKGGKHF